MLSRDAKRFTVSETLEESPQAETRNHGNEKLNIDFTLLYLGNKILEKLSTLDYGLSVEY